MAILIVGPDNYQNIGQAIAVAFPGDIIILTADYSDETATITKSDLTISGTSTSLNIELLVANGINGLTLLGDAPINVTELGGNNTITGNDGNNVFSVTGGIDIIDGGLGSDRLVVDYSATLAAITGTTVTISSDLGTVSVIGASVEHYTVSTGDGIDTLTFLDGDNVIDAGTVGGNTITAGSGDNTIISGSGIDGIITGNGDNFIDAGTGGANTITAGPTGAGNNTIISGSGIDGIITGNGDNFINAGTGGANTITAGPTGAGNNTIISGSGIDTILVGSGNNYIDAGTGGANTITAGPTGAGNNTIISGNGIDGIITGHGDNIIDAGTGGANTITVGDGNNIIISGSGIDGITAGNGDNYILGGQGANTIAVGSGSNVIISGGGIDILTATGGGNNNIVAGEGANAITTGAGNDVVSSGDAADTIVTGAGNDVISDTGGAGGITAGTGHDRLIMDFSTKTAAITSTVTGVESHGGVFAGTTYSGVEEFHVTMGSGNDTIATGDGADVLSGGAGADSMFSGRGSDVIYGGVGDVVDGGENLDDSDFDVLVLKDFGPYEIVNSNSLNPENGTIYQLDAVGGNRIGSVVFTNIESIEFVDNTVTTPEDTVLEGNLFASTTTMTIETFVVASVAYSAGETAQRTEGDLTINSNGSYTFTPAHNYNGPGPIATYTTINTLVSPPASQTSNLMINVDPVEETIPDYMTGAVCFALGTLISTANGEIPIEELNVGDLVQTFDHGLQPLRWIGRRHLDARELSANNNLRPIRIQKEVMGGKNGIHDLVVSPQHRLLIASRVAERMFERKEVLIAAKHLLGIKGVDIATDFENVTYFHILFDQHNIVYANGVLAESLYLGHQAQLSLSPSGRTEIQALFPEFASPSYLPISCRPIIGSRKAKKLALRHAKNSKPLLESLIIQSHARKTFFATL